MRKLKCFFLMLVLSFALLSSSVVFAAETEVKPIAIPYSGVFIIESLSQEQIETVRNLLESDAPYFLFISRLASDPNRVAGFRLIFYPDFSSAKFSPVPNRPGIINFFGRSQYCLWSQGSVVNFSDSSSFTYQFCFDKSYVINSYSSPNCTAVLPSFSYTHPQDGSSFTEASFKREYPYGINLRLVGDELFFHFPPSGNNISSVTSVSAESSLSENVCIAGTPLDLSDIELSIHRDDNTVEKVLFADFSARGVSVSPANGSVLDTSVTSVSVSYEGFTDSFPITVIPPSVSGISVASPPTKTQYYYGESLNLSGASLSVSFDNGAEETISFPDFAAKGVTADPEHGSALTEEIDSVVIAYKEQETLIPITVSPVKDSGVILTNIEENVRSLRDSVSLVVYGVLPVAVAILAIFIFLRWFTRTFIHSVIH